MGRAILFLTMAHMIFCIVLLSNVLGSLVFLS
ncbi:MAG: hypothetical protein ACI92Z_003594 [Paracoccaceae bacterium]|jgi:hypothetical protein